ncbi:NAD(P)/FAD-dependent oxidoreductase [Sphingomonas sp. HMP6]|uniref:NAD(P)/FAD-dependent oxidoreductase n=1 Tax=Sphingomonas sp. HMP6 TaxID=1517551 RepID=UPI001596A057|nr:NAD(P)/FAD-dependent oxidoreductase [Sphingomonas sp. HMP6]BCA57910.1 thioredoxin reductase [Sphingomonas sp. HMP6]
MDDCIIIGAGPAGLTAAIYLARFHLKIRLFDNGSSRAALIPRTNNHAGYPDGIPGVDLLLLMRRQAERFGAVREEAQVDAIEPVSGGFRVHVGDKVAQARTVLLATGVVNNRPDMPDDVHDEALARGLLRYCPICDGYEVTDKRVGVIGTGDHGMREALFLRGFTKDVTLIAPGAAHDLNDACRAKLEEAGIAHLDGPCSSIAIDGDVLRIETAGGPQCFDSVYPALGSVIRSELAVAAGARATAEGCLEVDDHQRTSIPGLFAAGDVVKGLDQISHAMGEAGVASTAIRNLLAERAPLLR